MVLGEAITKTNTHPHSFFPILANHGMEVCEFFIFPGLYL